MNRNYDNFRKLQCDTVIREVRGSWVSFENTVFFGEKGGMPSDQGTINGYPVLELLWEGDTLFHRVAGDLINPIHMEVDLLTRWTNAAVQSALHLLDGFYETQGLRITAISADPENLWYEVDSKNLPDGHFREVQAFMEGLILHSVRKVVTYLRGRDCPDENYRQYDEVRLVRFGNINTQPCATPHVNETQEILSFAILGHKKSSRGTRVFFACGPLAARKLEAYSEKLQTLAAALKTNVSELPQELERLAAASAKQKKELKALKSALLRSEHGPEQPMPANAGPTYE